MPSDETLWDAFIGGGGATMIVFLWMYRKISMLFQ